MYKIEISEETKNKHLDYCKEKIYNKLEEKIEKIHTQKYKDFLSFLIEKFDLLIVGDTTILDNLEREIKYEHFEIWDEIKNGACKRKEINKIFGYDNFIKCTSGWNAYALVRHLNINVCPYCNEAFITTLLTEKRKVRADLDHYYPKSKYPYFSMSLYNLIPSCLKCNRSLKGGQDPGFNMLHPYKDNIDDKMKFSVKYVSLDNIEIEINSIKDIEKCERYIEFFLLNERYKGHSDIAKYIIVRCLVYSQNYLKELEDRYNSHEVEKEFMELLIGYSEDASKINKEPLLKLKSDIFKQMRGGDSKLEKSKEKLYEYYLNKLDR